MMPAARLRRLLAGCAGLVAAMIAAAGLRDPLVSMSRYTAALMILNQIVPPLLLLAMPARGRPASGLSRWLSDPSVAVGAFVLVTIAISMPGILDPALANALFSAPLGLAELLCGLLIWRQLVIGDWRAGLLGLVAGVPMTVVAVVWMMSSTLLYSPYLDVVCVWNISPLQDQRWAGFVMLLSGLPLQITSLWLLVRQPPAGLSSFP
jgi:putative membrane protein